jgi:murein DD-endopeptidase MepM/ murein hydrolase activator NlpD
MIALAVFAMLIVMGRHRNAEASTAAAPTPRIAAADNGRARDDDDSAADVWLQPLARVAHAVVKRDRRLFYGREGLPASECAGARCSIEIDAAPDAIVMAVHDGVVEAVERDATAGEQGRFVRINHKGGEFVSSYFHLDGIREDLAPGIPVHAGEAIGTVARPESASERPHFRFAMATRNASDGSILFIDPQPMLALWPSRHDSAMSLHAMEHGN